MQRLPLVPSSQTGEQGSGYTLPVTGVASGRVPAGTGALSWAFDRIRGASRSHTNPPNLVASAEIAGDGAVTSFDPGLDRTPTLRRLEPASQVTKVGRFAGAIADPDAPRQRHDTDVRFSGEAE